MQKIGSIDISDYQNPWWAEAIDRILFFYPKTIDAIGVKLSLLHIIPISSLESGLIALKVTFGVLALLITLYFARKFWKSNKKHWMPVFGILTLWALGSIATFYTQSVIVCTPEEMESFFKGTQAKKPNAFLNDKTQKPEPFSNQEFLKGVTIQK